jgi:PAS domain S-box-containing protein
MIGKTDFDFLGREEAETLTKIKREVLASGEPVHMEVPLVSLKGGIEYFDGSYVPQRGPDGKVDGLIGYFRNVTEHKRAEETLHEREEIYSSIVNQAADGIVLAEAHSGRFVEFNRAAHEGLGYSREEFAQLAVSDIDVGIGPENLHDHMAATFAQGQVVFDTCQRHRNGELRDVRVSVRSLTIRGGDYFAAIWSDITERKRAADTLRESEAHYRSLFDNMLNGFAYCRMLFEQDRPVDFTYLSVNLAFETLTGLKAVVGKNVSEVIPGIRETNPELIEIYGRVALSGRPEQFETYVEPLGMWFSISVYSPQKEHFVAVFDVITDRKQAQERLQVHQQQLRALASELSLAEERERRRIAMSLHDHTCQNLVLVRMKLDELLESAPAAQAEAFHGICNVLSDTIEDVRELTFDLSSPTLYKFGLEAALEELLEDKFGAEQDVEYDFSDDGESKPLTDDVRVLLFQSVREILINILKHARARNITLDIRRAEGSIRIAVTDDGVGFDVDEVSSLPARQRGFGLFSIKERLDCIGGSLEIDSQRGVGSQFTLVAPLKVEGHDSGRTHDVGEDSARG